MADAAYSLLGDDGIGDTPDAAHRNGLAALRTLPDEHMKLLLADSISALPLHKALVLRETLDRNRNSRFDDHERLALAKTLVYTSSNLHFGPEVGVGPVKPDAEVITPWLNTVRRMADDLRQARTSAGIPAVPHRIDARQLGEVLAPGTIDAVITSPPYPNEKDYTRTTRLESVVLGFIQSKSDLQALKHGLIRSNTRGVYKSDDDDQWIASHPDILRIADEIEARRIELGKTSS